MKVLLVCATGMSTSLLTNAMRKAATPDDVITAVAYPEIDDVQHDFDVILLGPQIRFRLNETAERLSPKPVAVVDMRAYGNMDGATVMIQARQLHSERTNS